eukprot:SAG11_NODE_27_length_23309_cov_10.579362_26_plen_321_part_00
MGPTTRANSAAEHDCELMMEQFIADEVRVTLHHEQASILLASIGALLLWYNAASAATFAQVALGVLAARLAWDAWLARRRTLPALPRGALRRMAAQCKTLTGEQLTAFDRDGFIVLRQVVPQRRAQDFASERIWPGLNAKGVYADRPGGWHTGAKWQACCNSRVANNNAQGAMIGGWAEGNSESFKKQTDLWGALFDSPLLRGALDDLHGRDAGNADGSRWCTCTLPLAVAEVPIFLICGVSRCWRSPLIRWCVARRACNANQGVAGRRQARRRTRTLQPDGAQPMALSRANRCRQVVAPAHCACPATQLATATISLNPR